MTPQESDMMDESAQREPMDINQSNYFLPTNVPDILNKTLIMISRLRNAR